ncbi:Hint domain-containing protein [Pseudaestuariivita atlantica]|uniref:Hint domain-containing protein n=1 Tax=Pseudaestuariivita atlantica TaxID=1317121 RepID=UPI00067AF7A9|nr:Hint domain-containing protein [Pseudaestuariivita atlantica]
MATFSYLSYEVYDQNGASANYAAQNLETDLSGTIDDSAADTTFVVGETMTANVGGSTLTLTFQGIDTSSPLTLVALTDGAGTIYLFSPQSVADTTFPNQVNSGTLASNASGGFTTCFARGTEIATPAGHTPVEDLRIGDDILTADGRVVQVKWLGRQTVDTRFGPAERLMPVRIAAGALGRNLPSSDLTVTADHGMVLGDFVINASALVNGHAISYAPLRDLGERYTVFHVETEAHDVILANGTPTETFIDYVGRAAFDNHDEYLALYGAGQVIPEMPHPRISSARHVPQSIRDRLGAADAAQDWFGLAHSA